MIRHRPRPRRDRPVLPDVRSSLVAAAHARAADTAHPAVPPRPARRPRWPVAALAAVGAGAAGAVGVALVPTPRDAPVPGPPRVVDARLAAATTGAQSAFAVFRGPSPQRPRNGAGPASRRDNLFLRPPIPDLPGDATDVAHARRLAIPGREIWVAPATMRGKAAICMRASSVLSAGTVGGTCAPLEAVGDTGLWMSGRPAPDDPRASWKEVQGLVPDGVREVVFDVARGERRTVRVHDNAVSASFERGPLGVRFVDAEGRRRRLRF
ncbi:hypothetical protein [Patulibacter sp. SYSU D01012]|uniref:hypothetical protein n=1 Tax=Patulibacter sp. SYSU D01012 TaxID=2817381 RepID=UPI001B315A3D|nr:hypothetical protein [Patulibacter sp. SYSU D01012]